MASNSTQQSNTIRQAVANYETETIVSQRQKKEYTFELSNEEYYLTSKDQPSIIVTLTLDDIECMITEKQQLLEQKNREYSVSKKQRNISNIQILKKKLEELTKDGGY